MFKKALLASSLLSIASLGLSTMAQGAPDLREIYVRFCNDGVGAATKNLALNVNADEDTEICMIIGNNYEEELSIGINFIDGTVTNDAAQKPACKNETDKEIFGQYVQRDNELVTVPANSTVEKNVLFKFPEEYAGEVYGCVTARLASDIEAQNADTAPIAVINRLGYPLKFFVDGEVVSSLSPMSQEQILAELSTNTKVLATSEGAILTKSEEGYKAYIGLYNDGNVQQQLSGSLTLKTMKETMTLPLEQSSIQAQATLLIPVEIALPRYGFNVNLSSTITHQPQLVIADDTFESEEISFNLSHFVITLLDRIIIGVILLIILVICFRKKKKNTKAATTAKG